MNQARCHFKQCVNRSREKGNNIAFTWLTPLVLAAAGSRYKLTENLAAECSVAKRTEIDVYEAKTRLPAFLRKVEAGNRFTITQRGRPVAELLPYGASQRQVRSTVARELQAFMREQTPVTTVNVKALIEEGRD